MNIALVCPYDYFSPGGVQSHIRDSAAELRRLGHHVIVFAPDTGKYPDNIKDVVFIGKSKKINFNQTTFDFTIIGSNSIKKLKKILETEKFDIIHFHTIWTPFYSLQILYYSNSINICTFHDTPPDNLAGRITKILFRCISHVLFRYLDVIIAVSDTPTLHMARLPGKLIHIIPPCVDLSRYKPVNTPLYPGKDNQKTILFLSRLDRRKGLFVLLEAYKLLILDGLNIRLLIGGTGNEKEKLDRYLKSGTAGDIVSLGYVSDSDLPGCYASCDIFCAPALFGESFGIVLLEAMASGKAVVAAANPGYRNILDKKQEFCLVKPGDINDLYLKLKRLLTNEDLRYELCRWGPGKSEKYDCRTVIPKLVTIYQDSLQFK